MDFVQQNIWAISYFTALMVIIAAAYSIGSTRQRGISSSLFLLWLANILFTEATGDYTPELFFGASDFILGVLIWATALGSKWQLSVGLWFIPMMIAHIAFWAIEPQSYDAQYKYWVAFTFLGWGQLANVGLWLCKDSIRDSFSGFLGRSGNNLSRGI